MMMNDSMRDDFSIFMEHLQKRTMSITIALQPFLLHSKHFSKA